MTTLELWRYSVHLATRNRPRSRCEIRFWKKALYPLSPAW
jgi:lipopolysaccharide export system permease protein